MRRWFHWIHVGSHWMEMCGADMELFLIYSFVCWLLLVHYYQLFFLSLLIILLLLLLLLLRFVALPYDWQRHLRGGLVISGVVRCFGHRGVIRVDWNDFSVFGGLFFAPQTARLVRALQVQFGVDDGTVFDVNVGGRVANTGESLALLVRSRFGQDRFVERRQAIGQTLARIRLHFDVVRLVKFDVGSLFVGPFFGAHSNGFRSYTDQSSKKKKEIKGKIAIK